MHFLEWGTCFLSIKEGHLLKLLWSLNLNTVHLLGCFIVDVQTTKLIGYMTELLELFMMTTSEFDQLLAMDKSFHIHHQNIQRLLTEIYKALHDISGNSLKV